MTNFFKRLYTIILLMIIFVGIGMFFQYTYYNARIHNAIETRINMKLELMSNQIENHFDRSVQVIQSIEKCIATKPDDQSLLTFLEVQLETTPSYMSLYFGTPDNKMINGSGWIPPDEFDLRTRPWYIKAVEEQRLITTSLYMNASNIKRSKSIRKWLLILSG